MDPARQVDYVLESIAFQVVRHVHAAHAVVAHADDLRGLFQLPRLALAADLAATVEDRALWSRLGL